MSNYVLDTNMMSHLLKKNERVYKAFQAMVSIPENDILGCPIVYFEVKRGFLAKKAPKQLERFETLFSQFVWIDYTHAEWNRAADLWAQRRSQGIHNHDADLLIGVFALAHDAILVTDNSRDFRGLGLKLENWLQAGDR